MANRRAKKEQSARSRDSPCGQPRGHSIATGGLDLTAKPDVPRRAVPTFAQRARRPKAITAMAHRLARLVYRMLKYGQQYIDKGAEYYE
ncbi:MAG: hypothetical protein DMG49_26215 [Acidobacteria bacterium]|nr:MAG: hypothetical protein DMG49_26215 [Acidobacteriota bacterium]